MHNLTYHKQMAILTWGSDTFQACTGGHGKGPLPSGQYEVRRRNVVHDNSGLDTSFLNSQSGQRWFIPIRPLFSTYRRGLGIHPDGNVTGTEGCIGLTGSSASAFFRKWLSTPLSSRPTQLTVIGPLGM